METSVGNWETNALEKESRKSLLACTLGAETTNEIWIDNT